MPTPPESAESGRPKRRLASEAPASRRWPQAGLLALAVAAGVLLLWSALRPTRPEPLVTAAEAPAEPAREPTSRTTTPRPGTEAATRPATTVPTEAATPEAAPSARAAEASAVAEAPASDGDTVRVLIETRPTGARLFLKGKRIGTTPFTVELERGKEKRYSVWVEGYGMRSVLIDGSQEKVLLGLNRERPKE